MYNDYFKSLVKEMYELQASAESEEMETTRFTANIPVKDLYMIDAIAAKFGQSRASLVSEILTHAAESMFVSLKESDRDQLQKSVDESIDSHFKKSFKSYSREGLGYWQALANAFRSDSDANS